ncbi:MAG: sporulation protein YunB [Anaerovoracaceae bacterium]|nr:sporulation protein YunB [Anaerovoracaceae bacterium]
MGRRQRCGGCLLCHYIKKSMVILMGFLLLLGGCGFLFRDFYGESIDAAARAVAVNVVAVKINQTLNDGIYNEALDGELLKVERDSQGTIQYVEANSRLINKLVLAFSRGMEENYSLGDTEVVPVNLGVLTGNKMLSQLPWTVNIKVMPLSLTKFQCETEFETQAINQTRYKVFCSVTSTVQIVSPVCRETAEINRKVLLAEAILVGRVPDSYVVVPEEDILDVT